ncbi:MAG: copper chaperone PCu(A)C [Pseudomonadota bacterium]
MGKNSFIFGIAATLGLLALAVASAMETKVGTLVISDQNIRATVPTAKVAAGYLTIENTGSEADRLVGGTVDFASKVDIHEIKITDGVAKMRSIEGGLIIPPGETVALKSGAEHLMFMKLKEPMKEGETRVVILKFEKAGEVEVSFPVGGLGGEHSGHGNHGDHSGHGDHSDHGDHSGHSN